MGILCFVLDLRTLPPSLLRELKLSLLQLANFYAVYTRKSNDGMNTRSKPLPDRIGLCYLFTNRISCSPEMKVAYSPIGDFNLRDFHHAVNSLPTDALEFNSSGALSFSDLKISSVLNDKVLYSWGECDKPVTRKLFLLSCCIVQNLDFETKKTLMDAADKCVSIEFTFIEHNSEQLAYSAEDINNFVKQIGDLENCAFRSYVSDSHIYSGMVKHWFPELIDDMEELLQTRFIFKYNLIDNINQLSCNLYRCFNPIVDGFSSCQSCRCHGLPMEAPNDHIVQSCYCPVTKRALGELDLIENSVKIGESTVLLMPSFQCCQQLPLISLPIDFTVLKRTPIGSLSEEAIVGASYIVVASTYDEDDDTDNSEKNSHLFQVVCHLLSSLDQGLVCSSYCNVQTMREASFLCYYVLLPSDKGMMLLRHSLPENAEVFERLILRLPSTYLIRLVASEEILPVTFGSQFTYNKKAKEMEHAVQSSLLKIEASTYNPLQHERGFHHKINLLVKESLQIGAIPPKIRQEPGEPSSTPQDSEGVVGSGQTAAFPIREDQTPRSNEDTENMSSMGIAEEWENLVFIEVSDLQSPKPISKPKLDCPVPSSQLQSNRQVDDKTSKILERLEVPRQLKKKASPKTAVTGFTESSLLTKKPLIPFSHPPACSADSRTIGSQPTKPFISFSQGPSQNFVDELGTRATQPMKPSFPKLKRKR